MALTALLLTGGLSSRMGADKATLIVEGQPLWARQVASLRQLGPEAVWISAQAAPAWATPDINVVPDLPPSRGPLSGIAAALAAMTTSHLLALAVDLPRMTAEHLRKLVSRVQPGHGIIPSNQEQLEPLAAIYPKQAAVFAQSALVTPDVSMRSFAKRLLQEGLLMEYVLAPEELDLYLNVNTPQDLVQ